MHWLKHQILKHQVLKYWVFKYQMLKYQMLKYQMLKYQMLKYQIVKYQMLASIALLLSTGAPVRAVENPPYFSLARTEWQGTLKTGQGLHLTNLHGDLRVRDAGNATVEVSAVIQQDERDTERAQLAIAESPDGLSITVQYFPKDPAPEASGQAGFDPVTDPDHPLIRRVDVVVFLPPGAPLLAQTDRGLFEAKGLTSNVRASSTFGDLVVATSGQVELKSDHGAISVVFKGAAWPQSTLATLTGDIRVELPLGAEVQTEIGTSGEITTDYSIDIRRTGQGFHKEAKTKTGQGQHRLWIHSEKGAVKLLQSAF